MTENILAKLKHEPLGRAVTIGDLVHVHPGNPAKCLCRGTGQIATIVDGKRVEKECGAALNAFRKKSGHRCIDTERGPFWKIGESPEEKLSGIGLARAK